MTKPAPANTKPVPEFVTTAQPGDDQAQRYALGALRRAADNIAYAPPGTRNHTLNAESWSIGQLVKAGHLDYAEARDTLNQAAIECGLEQDEIDRTVPRAIKQSEARDVRLTPREEVDSSGIEFTPQQPAGEDGGKSEADVEAGGEVGEENPPSPEEQRRQAQELRFHADVQMETRRLAVAEEAKKQLRRAETQDLINNLTPPAPLEDFLAVEDPPISWVLEGLQPVGTRALLAAQAKSGKTTMVSNLIKALADQQMFLGDFFNHFTGTITLIDDELDDRMLRRWLRNLQITHPERVRVVTLRGRLADFNIVDDQIRHVWANLLAGTDYLILDCLRPVLDACGLDENHEAGIFLNAFDALLKEGDIDNALVVHHMGHSSNRSRGDSRIMDWPDSLWKLRRENPDEPSSKRHFSAFGREVDVKEQPLHYSDGHLVLNNHDGTSQPKKATTPEEWVIETYTAQSNPEPRSKSWWEAERAADVDADLLGFRLAKHKLTETLNELIERGDLIKAGSARGGGLFHPNPHSDIVSQIVTG